MIHKLTPGYFYTGFPLLKEKERVFIYTGDTVIIIIIITIIIIIIRIIIAHGVPFDKVGFQTEVIVSVGSLI
jgi:hypothetical protein